MTNQTILITGATSGIGRAAALHLARLGHRVYATGRRLDALEALKAEAGDLPLDVLPMDVNDEDSVAAAAREVHRRTDGYGVDVLVNNAGFARFGPVALVPDDELRAQFETNVFGLVRVVRAFLPAMRERGRGTIINVSSLVGRMNLILQGVYCATKHAVEALSDSLRREVAGFGIRVSVVEPGAIRTGFENTAGARMATYDDDPVYAPALRRWADAGARIYRKAPGPAPVVRTIARIVRARRPRARYVSPSWNVLTLWLVKLLPTSWADRIFRRAVGL
ncbi:MAG: SDR family oxidoreductase [Deltaproteobacteria bacterium]|nr:SDR family oxidoreductase [Deltaproteobacteria bacterium]